MNTFEIFDYIWHQYTTGAREIGTPIYWCQMINSVKTLVKHCILHLQAKKKRKHTTARRRFRGFFQFAAPIQEGKFVWFPKSTGSLQKESNVFLSIDFACSLSCLISSKVDQLIQLNAYVKRHEKIYLNYRIIGIELWFTIKPV